MIRLIKMDFYRMFKSKFFWIALCVLFILQFAGAFGMPFLVDAISNYAENPEELMMYSNIKFSDMLSNPMDSIMMIIMFVSATAFLFADIKNGYIKNIAGQISQKGYTAISKFVVVCFHNLVFMTGSVLAYLLGSLVCPKMTVIFDGAALSGLIIFFIKLMLTFAMTTVLLFITTGLYNSTLANVAGVLFSVGALGLIYAALDKLISVIGIKNVTVTHYIPDQLYFEKYDISAWGDIINAVIVSLVFIVVFLLLTVSVFNKRDVK